MAKLFLFRGYELEKLKTMTLKEFGNLIDSKYRRKIKRGFTAEEKKFLKDIEEGVDPIKTHCRAMLVLPMMVGKAIYVHTGREFSRVDILPEMLGHRIGEFAETRRRVKHGAPGMGATKSSTYVPLK
jgi:small subunit ribosomal protein S19